MPMMPHFTASSTYRSVLAATLLCVCATVPVFAADYGNDDDVDWGELPISTNVNDIRLSLSLLPANAEIKTQNNGATSYHGNYGFEEGGRTALTWMIPLGLQDADGGFIAGLEASRNRYVMPGSALQPKIDNQIWALTTHLGMGWVVANHLHLETTASIGYGTCSMISGHRGSYWEYGARAGLYYTFTNRFQLGLHLSYLDAQSSQDYTENTITYESDVRSKGGYGGILFGWRL